MGRLPPQEWLFPDQALLLPPCIAGRQLLRLFDGLFHLTDCFKITHIVKVIISTDLNNC